LTYRSDQVISYELGAKNRLLGWQLNTSVYYIDWRRPQTSQRLNPCGHTYIDNAGGAYSRGLELQGRGRIGPINLAGSATYTDARYTKDVYASAPLAADRSLLIKKGDALGAPALQLSLSGEYRLFASSKYPTLLRADNQYTGDYRRSTGPGTTGYQPLVYNGQATDRLNLRLSTQVRGVEFSLFVKNATNNQGHLEKVNQYPSPVVSATTATPREAGLSVAYRY
jgi:outer membrane receptor for ferric coprogen and ferric-rhodotorulic acid